MRVYRSYLWSYLCDRGHAWTVTSREGAPEEAVETRCPEGHEAVTCHEALPADEVQILLRPAARVVDRETGNTWHSGRYFLVLLDRADRELCASKAH
jgi:hypothetical protein